MFTKNIDCPWMNHGHWKRIFLESDGSTITITTNNSDEWEVSGNNIKSMVNSHHVADVKCIGDFGGDNHPASARTYGNDTYKINTDGSISIPIYADTFTYAHVWYFVTDL